MTYAIVGLLSYLVGAINPARLIAKYKHGIDITKVNSKNPGTSNMAVTFGMRYAVIVGLLDIFKGFLPVLIVRILYSDDITLWFVAGLSAILGHMYPVYNRFKGGKGTATFGGMVLAIVPVYSVIMAILFTIILFATKFITISTMFLIIGYPILFFILDFPPITIYMTIGYSILSFIKHYQNIVDIVKKEALSLDAVKRTKKKEED